MNRTDTFKDIIRATCGGCSQSVKDYLYESMKLVYSSAKPKQRRKQNA